MGHGKGENAEDFASSFQKVLSKTDSTNTYECVGIQAPHILPSENENVVISEWWRKPAGVRSYECTEFEGGEISLRAVETIWVESGPFDGIMGFSQGAILLAGILAKGILSENYPIQPKFAMLFG